VIQPCNKDKARSPPAEFLATMIFSSKIFICQRSVVRPSLHPPAVLSTGFRVQNSSSRHRWTQSSQRGEGGRSGSSWLRSEVVVTMQVEEDYIESITRSRADERRWGTPVSCICGPGDSLTQIIVVARVASKASNTAGMCAFGTAQYASTIGVEQAMRPGLGKLALEIQQANKARLIRSLS